MARSIVTALVFGFVLLLAGPVWSGSYLNRSALLVDGSQAERDMVRPRATDKELLEVVHEIAAARIASAKRMQVPKSVGPAHPHLLLVLENTERAYAAARAGNLEKFVVHIERARAEDSTFRAIIAKLGYSLPPTSFRR